MPLAMNPGDSPSSQVNPANETAKALPARARVPMSVPQQRLEVPEIPGFHLHWFLGRNVPRALRAGYTHVQDDEVSVNNLRVGDDAAQSGNTDMGTNISQFAGGLEEGSAEPQRLYLMKLPQELRDEDVAAMEAANEKIAAALRGGALGSNAPGAPAETAKDKLQRYLKTGQDLFIPKRR